MKLIENNYNFDFQLININVQLELLSRRTGKCDVCPQYINIQQRGSRFIEINFACDEVFNSRISIKT